MVKERNRIGQVRREERVTKVKVGGFKERVR